MEEAVIREKTRALIRGMGATRAAKRLGIARATALALAADAAVSAGSLALAREALREQDGERRA